MGPLGVRMTPPPTPTHKVEPCEGGFGLTTYYPQMGGYFGICRVTFDAETSSNQPEPGCFNVDIWHDGQFPFTGERRGRLQGQCEVCTHPYEYEAAAPSHLHHCGAEQFVEFGLEVLAAQTTHQRVRVSRAWRDEQIARLHALPVRE